MAPARPVVDRARRRLGERWRLFALCVGTSVVEAIGLLATNAPASDAGLAGQADALAPFGVFHDLRFVSVYQNSWLVFAGEFLALLVVRGVLTGATVRAAWPAGAPAPAWGALALRGVATSAAMAVLLSPAVVLVFALAVAPISWLFLAAVPYLFVIALLVGTLPVERGWWARPLPLRAVGWIALTFVVISAQAALAIDAPAGVAVLVAALAGVFNARAWIGVVGSVVRQPARRRVWPVAPAGVVVFITISVLLASLGFARARDANRAPPAQPTTSTSASQPARNAAALLVVSGYGSHWDGVPDHPIPGPFAEERFSYRGLDRSGAPEAFSSVDTTKSLPELVRLLTRQVGALRGRTGRRVDIAAESEGALVAAVYLATTRSAPVAVAVLASPLLAPGRVVYPGPGRDGWGEATRAGMQALADAFRSAPIDLSPDAAFLSSIDADGPRLQRLTECRPAGVREFDLAPLADALAAPMQAPAVPMAVVPAFHGALLDDPGTRQLVSSILRAGSLPPPGSLVTVDHIITRAATAWQAPSEVVAPAPATSCAD